ncbi:MAG TPA: hypothetical protein VIY48_02215, partial [Candidatus Paceibacterota bacterium]
GISVRIYEYLAVALIVIVYTGWIYHEGGGGPKAELKACQAEVIAEGKAAEKVARAHEEHDKQAKEVADANAKKLLADNADLGKRLRNARSRSGFLPKPPADSPSPERACFDRTLLESALQRLDDGVQGLISEGDASKLKLSTAEEWAKSIGAQ